MDCPRCGHPIGAAGGKCSRCGWASWAQRPSGWHSQPASTSPPPPVYVPEPTGDDSESKIGKGLIVLLLLAALVFPCGGLIGGIACLASADEQLKRYGAIALALAGLGMLIWFGAASLWPVLAEFLSPL